MSETNIMIWQEKAQEYFQQNNYIQSANIYEKIIAIAPASRSSSAMRAAFASTARAKLRRSSCEAMPRASR